MDGGLILAGFIVGTLIGLSGMGGGSLLTPILIGIVGVRPLQAVGTDFVFAAITKVLGSFRHLRLGTVDTRLALRLAIGSVPGVLLGTTLLHRLNAHHGADADRLITRVLGATLLVVACTLAWRVARPAERNRTYWSGEWSRRLLIPLAFVFGVLVGITSVGSGTLFVVILTCMTPLPLQCVVGTDVAHALMLTGAGAIAHASAGNVNLHITASLLVGSLPGVWLGSSFVPRLPRRVLSGTVATLLFVSGVYLI